MFEDLLSLIYPRNCVACGNSLFKHEEQVCNYCYLNLPKSNFHKQDKNPVEILFYGRAQLVMASSFYLFHKKGSIQKVLHSIKYKGNKELAALVGKWYAQDLANHEVIYDAHVIIPFPLHQNKLKQRGYNQSTEFAKGLANTLNIKLNPEALQRIEYTSTQTKKSKYERWENVEDVFQLTDKDSLKGKHVVLVDDVITTGATIEACYKTLQQVEDIKISVLSIAYAEK